MPGGAILQLAAYGAQDVYLTGNPQMTYFIAVYKRHTNFAIESIEEVFVGHPDFDNKCYVILGRYGDLVNEVYLNVELPSFECEDFPVGWTNSIGHALIKRAEIEIGGEIIDTHYSQWLEIWSELTLPAEKKCGYYEMIGKTDNFNVTSFQDGLKLKIPLQFWFCRNIGLSLPLIALQDNEVRINILFRKFEELWVSSTGKLNESPENKFSIQNAIFYVDYIFLDDTERRWFAKTDHIYLIEQLQTNTISMDLTSVTNVIQLDFNHPIKELIWVIQDCTVLEKIPGGGNEWFNFSDRSTTTDDCGEDPLIEATLWFEGRERFCTRDAKYFRLIQPYQRHTRIPNSFIYVYSFALHPELHQPSGTCNFSMLDNPFFNMVVKDGLIDPQLIMFAPNYNILRVKGGRAGLAYYN